MYLFALAFICFVAFQVYQYRASSYYAVTHYSYLSVLFDKGRYGEYLTYRRLKALEKDGARFLFNTYLPKSNGETTEIDVLMIHPHGLFVFESKNYSGWIFGSEHQKTWTQSLPKGKGLASQKEHFLNPIFQNKLHIDTLKQIIGANFSFHSIIVFSERCTLKNITVSDPSVRVINRNDVNAAVSSMFFNCSTVISQQEINRIYDTLYPFSQTSEEVRQKHIEAIQTNHIAHATVEAPKESIPSSESANQVLTCPKCGAKLVLRTSSRGANKGNQFYGCSNYPKCRHIQNI